jgi:drug/metabolite transporter (DMT)-like permease
VGVLLIEQAFTVFSGVNVGDFLVLGGDLAAAIYVILAVKVAATAESLPMTACQFAFGALFSLPFAVWQWLSGREPFPTSIDPRIWLVAMLVGGVGFVGSYLLYNYVINFVPAGLAGVTLNLIPLFGVLTAVIFLGEHPTVWHIIGGIILISGIMWFPTGKHNEHAQDGHNDRKDAQPAGAGTRAR